MLDKCLHQHHHSIAQRSTAPASAPGRSHSRKKRTREEAGDGGWQGERWRNLDGREG